MDGCSGVINDGRRRADLPRYLALTFVVTVLVLISTFPAIDVPPTQLAGAVSAMPTARALGSDDDGIQIPQGPAQLLAWFKEIELRTASLSVDLTPPPWPLPRIAARPLQPAVTADPHSAPVSDPPLTSAQPRAPPV